MSLCMQMKMPSLELYQVTVVLLSLSLRAFSLAFSLGLNNSNGKVNDYKYIFLVDKIPCHY